MPYTFSLPSIADLSLDQRIALNTNVKDVLIVSGCPGSGKTTVALFRAKAKGNDHHYTVWANMLYGYLLNIAPQLQLSESHFSTFFSWYYWKFNRSNGFIYGGGVNVRGIVKNLENSRVLYQELQLDEGQDLPAEVRGALSKIASRLIICMDPAQDVNGECKIGANEIKRTEDIIRSYNKDVQLHRLTTNWRNTKPIFNFARNIVPELNNQTSIENFAKNSGGKPTLYEINGSKQIAAKIIEIIKNEPGRNIGIFEDSLRNLHELNKYLNQAGIDTTIYDNQEHRVRKRPEKEHFLKNMSNVVLSTFVSCKGLEFNTVIISDISNLSDDINKKKGYYVGCTRAQDRLIFFKNTSTYTLPAWFQRIDMDLYRTIKTSDQNSPF